MLQRIISDRSVRLGLASLVISSLILALPNISPAQKAREREPDLRRAGPPEPGKQRPTIGVEVNLVVLHTSVLDKNGQFVNGLRKEDFRVFEDRVEQQISLFKQEDVPITLGLVIDTSGSMRNKIDPVIQAALLFVKASNPEDEVFLIGFNTEATLVEDFTNDIDDLEESLNNLIVGGGTALYDALYLAVKKAQEGSMQKRAIIVISDGEDRDSYYKLEEVLDKIRESDVQVYAVGFLEPEEERGLFEGLFSKSKREKAKEVLTQMAEETGGKAVFPRSISELDGIVKAIAHELRNQYSIGYISSNQAKDGSWRTVRVVLNRPDAKNYKVRTRSGYYAPKVDRAAERRGGPATN